MLDADAFIGLSPTEAIRLVIDRYKLNPKPWAAPSWREPRLESLATLLSNPITIEQTKALDHLRLDLNELDSVIDWLKNDPSRSWQFYWDQIQAARAGERKRARARELAEGTLLRSAAETGNAERAVSLIREGAAVDSVDNLGRSSLYWAALKGYGKIVEILLEAGALVIGRKLPPLHAAAYGGHTDIALMLLERGAEINEKGFEGASALHEAAKGGHAATITLLGSHGADLEATSEYGTAMDVASHWGKPECVRALTALGAVERKDRMSIPEHVFISFPHRDRATAEEVAQKLREKEIPVWIASINLNPGTPDWEAAVRAAIKASFAVLLLASEESSASVFVRGELSVAESYGIQIAPVWIRGEHWADCIPLGMTCRQYIDARAEGRSDRFDELIRFLGPLMENAIPRHRLVMPFWRIAASSRSLEIRPAKAPRGTFSVVFTPIPELPQDGAIGAFFSSARYASLREFLDDLYSVYLAKRFKPFSYGTDWILREYEFVSRYLRLLAPWSALTGSKTLNRQPDEQWLFRTSLSDSGLEPGSIWEIVEPIPASILGLAVNDKRIFDAVHSPNIKTTLSLWDARIIERSPVVDLGDRLPFRYVLSDKDVREPVEQYLMIQTDRTVSEDEMRYLSGRAPR